TIRAGAMSQRVPMTHAMDTDAATPDPIGPSAASAGDESRAFPRLGSGPSMVYALRSDPRFSYCLYVPPEVEAPVARSELVVAVHGSLRLFIAYRDAFAAFAEWNRCVVLCPLFPVGVHGDENGDGYKYLHEREIRYDRVLLSMVNEASERCRIAFDTFGLFGYSGGGHFAHRFYTLHPQRLWAVSIGAPGSVSLLDRSRDWWVGVRNVRELFGVDVDIEAMRRVPVQMIVGRVDLETFEIMHHEGEPYWMPGANDSGGNRPERLARLRACYEQHGIAVRFDLVRDVGHDALRCAKVSEAFFADVLRQRRG